MNVSRWSNWLGGIKTYGLRATGIASFLFPFIESSIRFLIFSECWMLELWVIGRSGW